MHITIILSRAMLGFIRISSLSISFPFTSTLQTISLDSCIPIFFINTPKIHRSKLLKCIQATGFAMTLFIYEIIEGIALVI